MCDAKKQAQQLEKIMMTLGHARAVDTAPRVQPPNLSLGSGASRGGKRGSCAGRLPQRGNAGDAPSSRGSQDEKREITREHGRNQGSNVSAAIVL